jgi:hypothetical protein
MVDSRSPSYGELYESESAFQVSRAESPTRPSLARVVPTVASQNGQTFQVQ